MKKLLFAGVLTFACALLFLSSFPKKQVRRIRDNNIFRVRIQKQIACETKIIADVEAKEIASGPEYQKFLIVASAFGRKNVPHFYIAQNGGLGAQYIFGSLPTDGRGKILISQNLINGFGSTSQALKGVFGHEMGHLESDNGTVSCDQSLKDLRDPKEEEAADALAANKVGYGPIRATLFKFKKLLGGKNKEVDTRLQALKVLEKKEARRR